ncbi:hypothetical protein [Paraburkholderia ferrariae]|uniref:hypothetical protein n=1 Tax=Paraburkholderia ferrariae TaxID=386056 RepID=UPI0012EBF9CA|nr:hypothetical protein [Paraburkholderia ferrariae]
MNDKQTARTCFFATAGSRLSNGDRVAETLQNYFGCLSRTSRMSAGVLRRRTTRSVFASRARITRSNSRGKTNDT